MDAEKIAQSLKRNALVVVWDAESTFLAKIWAVLVYISKKSWAGVTATVAIILGILYVILRGCFWLLAYFIFDPALGTNFSSDTPSTSGSGNLRGILGILNPAIQFMVMHWSWLSWLLGAIFLVCLYTWASLRYNRVRRWWPFSNVLLTRINTWLQPFHTQLSLRGVLSLVLLIWYFDMTTAKINGKEDGLYPWWITEYLLYWGFTLLVMTSLKLGFARTIVRTLAFVLAHFVQLHWEYLFLDYASSSPWSERWTLTDTNWRVEWISIYFLVVTILFFEFIGFQVSKFRFEDWNGFLALYPFVMGLFHRWSGRIPAAQAPNWRQAEPLPAPQTPPAISTPRQISQQSSSKRPTQKTPPETPQARPARRSSNDNGLGAPETTILLEIPQISLHDRLWNFFLNIYNWFLPWYNYIFGGLFGNVIGWSWKVFLFIFTVLVIPEVFKLGLNYWAAGLINITLPSLVVIGSAFKHAANMDRHVDYLSRLFQGFRIYFPYYIEYFQEYFWLSPLTRIVLNGLYFTWKGITTIVQWIQPQDYSLTTSDKITPESEEEILGSLSKQIGVADTLESTKVKEGVDPHLEIESEDMSSGNTLETDPSLVSRERESSKPVTVEAETEKRKTAEPPGDHGKDINNAKSDLDSINASQDKARRNRSSKYKKNSESSENFSTGRENDTTIEAADNTSTLSAEITDTAETISLKDWPKQKATKVIIDTEVVPSGPLAYLISKFRKSVDPPSKSIAETAAETEDLDILGSAIRKYGKLVDFPFTEATEAAAATAITSRTIPAVTSSRDSVDSFSSVARPINSHFENDISGGGYGQIPNTGTECVWCLQFTTLSIVTVILLAWVTRSIIRALTNTAPNITGLSQAVLSWRPLQWTLAFSFAYQEAVLVSYLVGPDSLWYSNKYLFLFIILAGFKTTKLIVNAISYYLYTCTLQTIADPEHKPEDVTVILKISSVNTTFITAVESILATGVAGIIITTTGLAMQQAAVTATKRFVGRVRIISTLESNKRGEIVKALQYVRTPLVALKKGGIVGWPGRLLATSLIPFQDPLVGMVATSRHILPAEGDVGGFSNALASIIVEEENYEAVATSNIDGGVFKLDGPVRIIRTEILHSLPFRQAFLNETWLGTGPLVSDSETFITRFIAKRGYKLIFNHHADAVSNVVYNPTHFSMFLARELKRYRSNYRHAIKTLVEDRVCWYAHPWTTYSSFLFFFDIPLFYDAVLFLLLWKAGVEWFCGFLFSLLLVEIVRQLPFLLKLPGHDMLTMVIFFPITVVFHYLCGFLKLYALFSTTINPGEMGNPRLALSGGTGVM